MLLNVSLLEVNIGLLVAGLFGGIMRIWFVPKIKPRDAVRHIVAGALAGNFFVPPLLLGLNFIVPQLLKMLAQVPPELLTFVPGLLAFVVGMGGLRYCKMADKWLSDEVKSLERKQHD